MRWNASKGLLALLLGITLPVAGQVLEEKTEIKDEPRGEAVWELQQGQRLYAGAPEGSWYPVRKKVRARMEAWDGTELQGGAELLNEEGQEIGRILDPWPLVEVDTVDPFRKDPYLMGIIEGWVFETKWVEGSLLEPEVERILDLRNRRDQREQLDELLEEYAAEEREFEEFTARVIREENRHLGEEQDFRLIVVMRGSQVFALISKDAPLRLPREKDHWQEGNIHITSASNVRDDQQKLLEEIAYTYLAL